MLNVYQLKMKKVCVCYHVINSIYIYIIIYIYIACVFLGLLRSTTGFVLSLFRQSRLFGCVARTRMVVMRNTAVTKHELKHKEGSLLSSKGTSSSVLLLLVVRPGAPFVASLLLVAMPAASSSFLLLIAASNLRMKGRMIERTDEEKHS